MVLKKSNSRLNSGATQRGITHRGVYMIHNPNFVYYNTNQQSCLRLTADMKVRNNQAMESLSACLDNVRDYLELDNHKVFIKLPDRRNRNLPEPLQIEEYCLDKKTLWMVSSRIIGMMRDIEFITHVSPNIGLRLNEVWDPIIQSRGYKPKKKVTSSSEIIAKSLENIKQKQNEKKSKTKQHFCQRGVQRPHLFAKKQKPDHAQQPTQGESQEQQIGHLDLHLYAPFRIEARSVRFNKVCKKYSECCNTSRLKSSTKLKGRNKGKKPSRKGYSNSEFRYDQMNGLSEVYDDINDEDGLYKTWETTLPKTIYDINDLITQPYIRVKRKKAKKNSETVERDETHNDAPSNDRIRYSKRSYIVIPREEYSLWVDYYSDETQSGYTNSDKSSKMHLSSSKLDENYTIPSQQNHEMQNLTTSHSCQEFDDCIIQVSLVLSTDQEEWFSSSKRKKTSERLLFNEHIISTGESIPPCFVVDLISSKTEPLNDSERFLTARKNGLHGSNWLISVQDKWQTPRHTKQQLEQLLADRQSTKLSLSDLIEVVKLMENTRTRDDPSTAVNKPISDGWLSSYCIWHKIPQNAWHATDICTVEEASRKIHGETSNNTNASQTPYIPNTILTAETNDESQFSECATCLMPYNFSELANSPIALLPCSHVYCITCWRSHLQHSIRSGANKILCMDTNCMNVLDLITASTIVPCGVLFWWQIQVRDRCIDSSPFYSWCPNVVCRNVAVSRNGPMKLQFGKPVICNCNSCWCSGCHGEPHWPASCDQIAAYKKLIAKVNTNFMVGSEETDLEVQIKKCPSCKYPIEKECGCPSMVCVMCSYAFCWNCMKKSHTHGTCEAQNVETTKYSLANKLQVNLPLKCFSDCLMLKRKNENLFNLKPWLERLRDQAANSLVLSKLQRFHEVSETARSAVLCAEETVFFLKQFYTFQQTMRVLTDFAGFNKCGRSRRFARSVLCKMLRLDFIASRLEEKVVGSSLAHMCTFSENARTLMQAGQGAMAELSLVAPVLQNLSKDIETFWVGELDPNTSVRYI